MYTVYFFDCDGSLTFDTKEEAIEYAKFNNGVVRDMETWELIADYSQKGDE